ncbi:LOW QUALITY PROTEIN: hypothetical protein BC937DRAFT_88804 [Endogone sp. FLAS-F59071]|nr:LOW QUALITY PROTEIN: hypothetical protein BC937DRAFT_88804 [Endogone sp. FLAS-F59071]|eukprot:RUS18405.1 LOW QUALITY PROTEIN: hypothetical protein BC937DRAFT_88804 [Endogone sp. FLAS-F59071]
MTYLAELKYLPTQNIPQDLILDPHHLAPRMITPVLAITQLINIIPPAQHAHIPYHRPNFFHLPHTSLMEQLHPHARPMPFVHHSATEWLRRLEHYHFRWLPQRPRKVVQCRLKISQWRERRIPVA